MGLPFLYGLGVVHVCALESACAATAAAAALLAGQAQVQRVVLLSTQLLPDTHSAALRALQVCCKRSKRPALACFSNLRALTWFPK